MSFELYAKWVSVQVYKRGRLHQGFFFFLITKLCSFFSESTASRSYNHRQRTGTRLPIHDSLPTNRNSNSTLNSLFPNFLIPLLSILLFVTTSCNHSPKKKDPLHLSWNTILKDAHGKTVRMMMWKGDPAINKYMNNFVKPALKKDFDIKLEISAGQGAQIVSILRSELEAGRSTGSIDLVWINGATFYQLRQLKALFGPFVSKLPNSKYLDLSDPFVSKDFQQPIDGYECPWGTVQFCIITDTARVPNPPETPLALENYVKRHPGSFTFSNDFTGMTFLKSLMIGMAPKGVLYGPFNDSVYTKYSARLWKYIKQIKPYLWKHGTSFPSTLGALHQLYENGEVNFTMSDNDAEVENKVDQGFFPKSSKAFILTAGTIRNSHYIGIPVNAPDKEAALVACNFLISPEAQYQKKIPKNWGDGTVLDLSRLPVKWQMKFKNLPPRKHALPRDTLRKYALPELAPEYMIRLYDDFRKKIIE